MSCNNRAHAAGIASFKIAEYIGGRVECHTDLQNFSLARLHTLWACLVAACPGRSIRHQVDEIQRLRVLPGSGRFTRVESKQAIYAYYSVSDEILGEKQICTSRVVEYPGFSIHVLACCVMSNQKNWNLTIRSGAANNQRSSSSPR